MRFFTRLKSIRGLAGSDKILLSDGNTISADEISSTFADIGKQLGVLTQAAQRIEKKQLRWLEILNAREPALTGVGQVALADDPGGDNHPAPPGPVPGEETEL